MNRTILKNIKTAILHSSKTEKEVWEYLDLSQEQWTRIFRGKEDLSWRNLEKIASFLETEPGDFLKDSPSFLFMYILSAVAGAFSFFLFLRVCFTTKLPLILFERTPSEAFYTSGLEKSFARLYFGLAILLFLIIGFVLLLLGKKIFPALFASSALTIGVSYLFYRTKMSRNIMEISVRIVGYLEFDFHFSLSSQDVILALMAAVLCFALTLFLFQRAYPLMGNEKKKEKSFDQLK